MKFSWMTFLILSLTVLSGCIDKDDDKKDDVPTFQGALTWDNIGDNMASSNNGVGDNRGYPFNNVDGGGSADSNSRYAKTYGKVKRWKIDSANGIFIPVKINGVPNVPEALDRIEARFSRKIFDRDSISATPDEQITHGLIFRSGTAKGPEGASCGHVGDRDSNEGYPYNWYQEDGEIQTVLSVNLGKDSGGCTVDIGLIVHEVMHALGIGSHYDGFGTTPPGQRLNHEGDLPYSVVFNLYFHAIGTHADDVVVQFPYSTDPDAAANQGRKGVKRTDGLPWPPN